MDQILSLSAIRTRKAALAKTIEDAQAQVADLEVAEQIVLRYGQEAQGDDPRVRAKDLLDDVDQQRFKLLLGPNPPTLKDVMKERLTTKALVLSILRRSVRAWITAKDIQSHAAGIRGREVPMATISPMLSILKNEGLIVRDGFKVALAERVKANEAPSGMTAGAPEAGGAATPSNHQPERTSQ